MPTETIDLSKQEYEFHGLAQRENLYSNYYFTGVSKVVIYVTNNHSNKTLNVYFKQERWGANTTVCKRSISAKNFEKWSVDVDSNTKYYLRFDAPCDFEGYIIKG